MTKLFIAVSSKDLTFAELAVQALKKTGHDVYHYKQAKTSASWPRIMAEKLEWADKVVCLVSPSFLASEFCKIELDFAFSRGKLVMVLIEPCKLSGQYSVILYLDLTQELSEGRQQDALTKLVAEFPLPLTPQPQQAVPKASVRKKPTFEEGLLTKLFSSAEVIPEIVERSAQFDERFAHGAEGYVLKDDDPDSKTE